MGGCFSEDATATSSKVIKTKRQLSFSKSDFITENQGKFRDFYEMGDVLGTGAFGEVRKCVQRATGIIRAVKFIQKNQMDKQQEAEFKSEVSVLKKLDHPNILRLYEVFEDTRKYSLVMELCNGGELFDEVVNKEKFTEKEASIVLQ